MRQVFRQVLVVAVLGLTVTPVYGQNATWLLSPGSSDFDTASQLVACDGSDGHGKFWRFEYDFAHVLVARYNHRLHAIQWGRSRLQLCGIERTRDQRQLAL